LVHISQKQFFIVDAIKKNSDHRKQSTKELGLAHAERFIRINSGRLTIQSQVGKGTTVTVILPVSSS